ncbi:unnamed protein product, partial [Mesorhabditis spiculigera]
MQIRLVVAAIIGFVCHQATADCPAAAPVSTNYIIGPSIANSCPTGYECIEYYGTGQCVYSAAVTCKDSTSSCGTWAKNGYCTDPKNAKTKATTCAYTCKTCTGACVDKSNNCATWIKNSNFCQSSNYDLATKLANCQKSCNLC